MYAFVYVRNEIIIMKTIVRYEHELYDYTPYTLSVFKQLFQIQIYPLHPESFYEQQTRTWYTKYHTNFYTINLSGEN